MKTLTLEVRGLFEELDHLAVNVIVRGDGSETLQPLFDSFGMCRQGKTRLRGVGQCKRVWLGSQCVDALEEYDRLVMVIQGYVAGCQASARKEVVQTQAGRPIGAQRARSLMDSVSPTTQAKVKLGSQSITVIAVMRKVPFQQ